MSERDDARVANLATDEEARNKGVVEALLIAADDPLGASRLSSVLGRDTGAKEIRAYVNDLNEEYAQTGRSFRVVEVAGGFQLAVHSEFAPWIRQLMREKVAPRLSQASLETLAILAFKQPITKAEVEHIRGVSVDGVLRQLMEKGLIRISGRSDAPGRPLLYGTTRDFLKHFGLKTLSDLPRIRELEELLREEEQRVAEGKDSPLSGVINTDGNSEQDAHDRAPEPVSGPRGGGFAAGERAVDSNGQR